jgi:hypothetical protein
LVHLVQLKEGQMAETARVGQDHARTEAPRAPSVEQIFEMQRPAMQAMADLNGKLYEGIVAVNREWASFLNRRLREDMAIPERLAACTTFQDMMRVYTSYFQDACSHYQTEFAELAKLNQSLAQHAMATLQSHMERAGQDRA